MIALIDARRDELGVEPICAVLPIAPSTYYTHKARERAPKPAPPRVQRDEALKPEITRVHAEYFHVYGVRIICRQVGREGAPVARCPVF